MLRPGERDRDADDADDDVDGRRRGAVSAGSWYVRADNAIRMGGGGVCTGGEVPWNAVWESQTRVVARRAAGAGVRRRRRRCRGGGGGVAASVFTLYRRRRVRLYTDDGSGRGGLLKCALTV